MVKNGRQKSSNHSSASSNRRRRRRRRRQKNRSGEKDGEKDGEHERRDERDERRERERERARKRAERRQWRARNAKRTLFLHSNSGGGGGVLHATHLPSLPCCVFMFPSFPPKFPPRSHSFPLVPLPPHPRFPSLVPSSFFSSVDSCSVSFSSSFSYYF
ncbi:unnamed protein product [Sphagnum troendelagicum]|uniref:Uncharacterized protein n=1 Tax=Sphagnum troendelagicum TaxID=128251 RepID=A0ABP0TKZ2_9BRYO